MSRWGHGHNIGLAGGAGDMIVKGLLFWLEDHFLTASPEKGA